MTDDRLLPTAHCLPPAGAVMRGASFRTNVFMNIIQASIMKSLFAVDAGKLSWFASENSAYQTVVLFAFRAFTRSCAWLTGTRTSLPGCMMSVGFFRSAARVTGEIDSRY